MAMITVQQGMLPSADFAESDLPGEIMIDWWEENEPESEPEPVYLDTDHFSETNLASAIKKRLKEKKPPIISRRFSPSSVAKFFKGLSQDGLHFFYHPKSSEAMNNREIIDNENFAEIFNAINSNLVSHVFMYYFVFYNLQSIISSDTLDLLKAPIIDTRTILANLYEHIEVPFSLEPLLTYYWGDWEDPDNPGNSDVWLAKFRVKILTSLLQTISGGDNDYEMYSNLMNFFSNKKIAESVFSSIDKLISLFHQIDWKNIVCRVDGTDGKPVPQITRAKVVGNYHLGGPPYTYLDLAQANYVDENEVTHYLEEVGLQVPSNIPLYYVTKGEVLNIIDIGGEENLNDDLATRLKVFLKILNVASAYHTQGFRPATSEYVKVYNINPFNEDIRRLVTSANYSYYNRHTGVLTSIRISDEEIPGFVESLKYFVETQIIYRDTMKKATNPTEEA